MLESQGLVLLLEGGVYYRSQFLEVGIKGSLYRVSLSLMINGLVAAEALGNYGNVGEPLRVRILLL